MTALSLFGLGSRSYDQSKHVVWRSNRDCETGSINPSYIPRLMISERHSKLYRKLH